MAFSETSYSPPKAWRVHMDKFRLSEREITELLQRERDRKDTELKLQLEQRRLGDLMRDVT
jgi:hypothetical protein